MKIIKKKQKKILKKLDNSKNKYKFVI